MTDFDCRAYVDRLLTETNRWIDARFEGADRVRDEKLADLDKRLAVQQTADERALNLAAQTVTSHFETINNFQRRIEAMEKLYVTREQLDARFAIHRLLAVLGTLFAAATFVLYLWRGH